MTVRLISPAGAVVSVSEEKAERLGSGWRPFEVEQPEPVEKPVTRRSRSKKSE